MDFIYDNAGRPFALKYSNDGGGTFTTYYYILNFQGDVVALLNTSGTVVARYTYNAWGEILSVTTDNGTAITGSLHIAHINPLRYRGYYYDAETEFYYLQSRYYDPENCRFINADCYTSTGQGFLGYNMFAYCMNCPVMYYDDGGCFAFAIGGVYLLYLLTEAVVATFVVVVSAAVVTETVEAIDTAIDNWNFSKEKEEEKKEEENNKSGNNEPEPPDVTYPGDDPAKAPDGYEWRGPDEQGGARGGYANPNGKDSWHPDLNHPGDVDPHWDYNNGYGNKWRVYPDRIELIK